MMQSDALELEADMPVMERGGYAWCFSCSAWEDDTDCFGDDHSRHCGHPIKPPSMSFFGASMVMVCIEPLKATLGESGPKLWAPGQ